MVVSAERDRPVRLTALLAAALSLMLLGSLVALWLQFTAPGGPGWFPVGMAVVAASFALLLVLGLTRPHRAKRWFGAGPRAQRQAEATCVGFLPPLAFTVLHGLTAHGIGDPYALAVLVLEVCAVAAFGVLTVRSLRTPPAPQHPDGTS